MQPHCSIIQGSPQWVPAFSSYRSFHSCTRTQRQRVSVTVGAARPKVVPDETSVVECLERSLHLPASAAPQYTQQSAEHTASRSSSKRTVDKGEVLHSTNEHRAWVYGATGLFLALLVKGASEIHTWQGAAGSAAAVLAAYYISGECRLLRFSALCTFSSACEQFA